MTSSTSYTYFIIYSGYKKLYLLLKLIFFVKKILKLYNIKKKHLIFYEQSLRYN